MAKVVFDFPSAQEVPSLGILLVPGENEVTEEQAAELTRPGGLCAKSSDVADGEARAGLADQAALLPADVPSQKVPAAKKVSRKNEEDV